MMTMLTMTSTTEMLMIVGGATFLTSLASGTILTAWMHRLSWRWGALDKPDGDLKCHRRPVATLGGIPLFLAMIAGMIVLALGSRGVEQSGLLAVNISRGALLVSTLVILFLGISDDLHQVRPRTKLLFQMMASTVLIGSGLVIHRCDFFGVFGFSFGPLAVPFTLFWLVGSCNAFNFIDGLDGLASGLGAIIALALAVLGFYSGAYGPAIMALAVGGALSAMVLFNVKPALIFLGDSGSQLIGLILGALAIKVATVQGVFGLPSAGLILSVPILDVFFSILRRYSLLESPARGDHRHIHHRLRRYGFSVPQTVVALWMVAGFAGFLGIAFRFATSVGVGAAALLFVVLELYLGIRLGCLNLGELGHRIAMGFRWKALDPDRQMPSTPRVAHLDVLWEQMKPLFEQMKLDRAILTLEGIGADGRTKYETFQWVRSDKLIAELLGNRWTKRFAVGDDASRIATLRLESTEQLRQDEEHINWLLTQIRSNMQTVAQHRQEQQQPQQESVEIGT